MTTEVVPEVPAELSLLEKVKLMNDLAVTAQDPEVADLIRGRPNGEKIYSLFVSAIERELAQTMNGKKEITKEVDNLSTTVKQTNIVLNNFRDMAMLFMRGPLVEVLGMMNKNLGGQNFQFTEDKGGNQQQPQQRQPLPTGQEYDNSADNGGGRRGTRVAGLGSV